MIDKLTKDYLQYVNGGMDGDAEESGRAKFDERKGKWRVGGIMKKDGCGTFLHRNVAKGHTCVTYFDTEKKANDWANKFLEKPTDYDEANGF